MSKSEINETDLTMDGKSKDVWADYLKQIKTHLPGVFSDNQVDYEKLKKLVGEKNVADQERYQFSWAGKSNGYSEIENRTTKTLKPQREGSVNFDETENIFIKGENLEVLKILQKSYYGKIKMIYIDPPYNTGNDFIYRDDYQRTKKEEEKAAGNVDEEGKLKSCLVKNTKTGHYHSNWLNMMFPRLFLARNLLREDGVIFVSIDDHEAHNLRMIMNEIFGEENFITTLQWKARGGRQDSTFVAEVHEYILMYAKNSGNFTAGEKVKEDESFPKYDKEKDKHYKTQLVRKWGANSRRVDRPNLYYSIKGPDGSDIYPKLPDGSDGCWRWSKKKLEEEIKKGNVKFVKKEDKWVLYQKIYEPEEGEERTKKFTSWLDEIPSTAKGTKKVKKLFKGTKVFDYPKPTKLMTRLMEIAKVEDNQTVLDFFAGSGSLAHAVFEQNIKVGGNRKFLLVQLPEETDQESEAYKAGYKTISDIAKERISLAADGFKQDEEQKLGLDNRELDLGFKSLKLTESNFEQWKNETVKDKETLEKKLEEAVENPEEKAQQENMLIELMLKLGIDINASIEGNREFYLIGEGKYAICLLEKIDQELVENIIKEDPQVALCLDSAFQKDDELKTNTALQMKDKDIKFKVV